MLFPKQLQFPSAYSSTEDNCADPHSLGDERWILKYLQWKMLKGMLILEEESQKGEEIGRAFLVLSVYRDKVSEK